jgi:GntR family transcriptional regulator
MTAEATRGLPVPRRRSRPESEHADDRDGADGPTRHPEVAYRMLAHDLRRAILADEFADGVRLPTEQELTEQRGLSRQTVRRAFQDLVTEGLVYRVRGVGTFASRRDGHYLRQFGSVEELMGLSLDTELELLVPLHHAVDAAAAERLGVEDVEALMSATFRRRHHGLAFCSTRVYLPEHIGRELMDRPEMSEVGHISSATVIGLVDEVGQPITEAEQSITATEAFGEIAAHLGVRPGTAVLRIDRLYFDAAGRAEELAISHFLPSHYSYRVRLRRSLR